jgi:hypothetical protein
MRHFLIAPCALALLFAGCDGGEGDTGRLTFGRRGLGPAEHVDAEDEAVFFEGDDEGRGERCAGDGAQAEADGGGLGDAGDRRQRQVCTRVWVGAGVGVGVRVGIGVGVGVGVGGAERQGCGDRERVDHVGAEVVFDGARRGLRVAAGQRQLAAEEAGPAAGDGDGEVCVAGDCAEGVEACGEARAIAALRKDVEALERRAPVGLRLRARGDERERAGEEERSPCGGGEQARRIASGGVLAPRERRADRGDRLARIAQTLVAQWLST